MPTYDDAFQWVQNYINSQDSSGVDTHVKPSTETQLIYISGEDSQALTASLRILDACRASSISRGAKKVIR